MGSRYAVEKFMQAAPQYGIQCEVKPSFAKFSFANGEKAVVQQMIRIWFSTNPPSHTDVDILEQGKVPILLSLGQMRNLRFTLEIAPDVVYLSSPVLKVNKQPVMVSTTKHLVLDLATVQPSYGTSAGRSFLSGGASKKNAEQSFQTAAPAADESSSFPVTTRSSRLGPADFQELPSQPPRRRNHRRRRTCILRQALLNHIHLPQQRKIQEQQVLHLWNR